MQKGILKTKVNHEQQIKQNFKLKNASNLKIAYFLQSSYKSTLCRSSQK